MALIERRIDGGNVAFCPSIRWIEPVCGPSFGYLRLLGRCGCGNGWSSILRTVLGLMPVSRATCRMETPFRRTRSRTPNHCATSRYMLGPSFRQARDAGERLSRALKCKCVTEASERRPRRNVQPIAANTFSPWSNLFDDCIRVSGPDEGLGSIAPEHKAARHAGLVGSASNGGVMSTLRAGCHFNLAPTRGVGARSKCHPSANYR
jgi:hypothetical protein